MYCWSGVSNTGSSSCSSSCKPILFATTLFRDLVHSDLFLRSSLDFLFENTRPVTFDNWFAARNIRGNFAKNTNTNKNEFRVSIPNHAIINCHQPCLMLYENRNFTIILHLVVRQWDAMGHVRVVTTSFLAQGLCFQCVDGTGKRTITGVWWNRRKVLTART